MHSKLSSFLFIGIVLSSSYRAWVSGTELKEERILGQTHEKFFYLDPRQLNFSYISRMFFSSRSRGGGWGSSPEFYGTKSMARAFFESQVRMIRFHQVEVVHCAKIYYHYSGTKLEWYSSILYEDRIPPSKHCQQKYLKHLFYPFLSCC